MNWNELLNPASLGILVPIVAILAFVVNSVMKHRERMAMIERGMDPDALKHTENPR